MTSRTTMHPKEDGPTKDTSTWKRTVQHGTGKSTNTDSRGRQRKEMLLRGEVWVLVREQAGRSRVHTDRGRLWKPNIPPTRRTSEREADSKARIGAICEQQARQRSARGRIHGRGANQNGDGHQGINAGGTGVGLHHDAGRKQTNISSIHLPHTGCNPLRISSAIHEPPMRRRELLRTAMASGRQMANGPIRQPDHPSRRGAHI